MIKTGKWWYILSLLWFINHYGQISFYADTNTREIKANEPIKFTIFLQINGNEYVQESLLQLPDLSKFEIIDDGSTRNTYIDPTKNIAVTQVMYQVLLIPKKIGKLKMGSALVTINGKIYKTEPFDISVEGRLEPKIAPNIKDEIVIKLHTSSQKVYQNEPIVLSLQAFTKNIDNFQKIENIQIPKHKNIKLYPLSQKRQDIEQIEGKSMLSQTLGTYLLVSSKSGIVELPEIFAQVSNGGKVEKIGTQKFRLKVEPLPSTAPVYYKNAVGTFHLTVKMEDIRKKIVQNKAFKVTLKLEGEGNLDASLLPKVIDNKDYTVYPPKISKRLQPTDKGMRGVVEADYIIVPKRIGKLAIEVEPLVFFDLKEKKYKTQKLAKIFTEVFSPEEDQKTDAMGNILGRTNEVLNMVQKFPKEEASSTQAKQSIIPYTIIAIILFLVGLGGFLFLLMKKKVTRKQMSKKKIQQHSIININTDLEQKYLLLKQALEENNTKTFFDTFTEIQKLTSEYLESTPSNLINRIEIRYGTALAENYRALLSKIEVEKYSPIIDVEQLTALYYEIINLHSQITE